MLFRSGQRFTEAAITNPEGFQGVNGLFRFRKSGLIERGLAILQVTPGGKPQVVEAAPDRFAPGTDPGLMEWFAHEQGLSRVESMVAVQRLASVIDTTPYLARIEAPVLAIYPSNGPITTPEQEALLKAHVRNLRLVHLPSEYHNLHLTQAAACAEHLLHFAARHDGIVCTEA